MRLSTKRKKIKLSIPFKYAGDEQLNVSPDKNTTRQQQEQWRIYAICVRCTGMKKSDVTKDSSSTFKTASDDDVMSEDFFAGRARREYRRPNSSDKIRTDGGSGGCAQRTEREREGERGREREGNIKVETMPESLDKAVFR